MKALGVLLLLLPCGLAAIALAQEVPAGAPHEALPATRVNPKDGAAMVLVPAGEFLMGTSKQQLTAWLPAHPDDKRRWFADEMPQRSVYLDAYYIYETPVTVAQYRRFCEATGREMPPAPDWGWQDADPILNVTWDEATAYADWAGVALPTEAQWEKAARVSDGRLFPWGDSWPPPVGAGNLADEAKHRSDKYKDSPFIAGYDDGYAQTAPVGSFPAGASPYGALDMAGNVREWCADWFGRRYYSRAPTRNPTGPPAGIALKLLRRSYTPRAVRGTSYSDSYPRHFRGAFRDNSDPLLRCDIYGFRCARGL